MQVKSRQGDSDEKMSCSVRYEVLLIVVVVFDCVSPARVKLPIINSEMEQYMRDNMSQKWCDNQCRKAECNGRLCIC